MSPKPIVKRALYALIAPLIWSILLLIEVLFFASTQNQNIFIKAFEGLVFVTSFLLLPLAGGLGFLGLGGVKVFLLYFAQVFFWWLVTFVIITLVNLKKGVNK